MSWRKLLFWLMFIAIPAAAVQWGVMPLKERRQEAVNLQQNADQQAVMNQKMSQERDQLEVLWLEFRPQAELELISLGSHLNPILLQNRVLDLARRLEVELMIQSKTVRGADALPTYTFSGSATPWQAHEFLRYLELGDHRVRFNSVVVVYNQVKNSNDQIAYISGEFSIPKVPEGPAEDDKADAISKPIGNTNDSGPEIALDSGTEGIG